MAENFNVHNLYLTIVIPRINHRPEKNIQSLLDLWIKQIRLHKLPCTLEGPRPSVSPDSLDSVGSSAFHS